MLSSSVELPQTMAAQPATVASQSAPQTVFEQSSPPHVVPQTMLSSLALFVPQTMLSSSDREPLIVPQASDSEQTVPHTIVLPSPVVVAPHVTSRRQAFASARSTPPPIR